MKRGTNAVMQVHLALDLDTVERIEFVFVQDMRRLNFVYPSERAIRDGENINLIWTAQETFGFASGRQVSMDTHVHLLDSDTNPETAIVTVPFSATLFQLEEIEHD